MLLEWFGSQVQIWAISGARKGRLQQLQPSSKRGRRSRAERSKPFSQKLHKASRNTMQFTPCCSFLKHKGPPFFVSTSQERNLENVIEGLEPAWHGLKLSEARRWLLCSPRRVINQQKGDIQRLRVELERQGSAWDDSYISRKMLENPKDYQFTWGYDGIWTVRWLKSTWQSEASWAQGRSGKASEKGLGLGCHCSSDSSTPGVVPPHLAEWL